jgi:hypothetical protein
LNNVYPPPPPNPVRPTTTPTVPRQRAPLTPQRQSFQNPPPPPYHFPAPPPRRTGRTAAAVLGALVVFAAITFGVVLLALRWAPQVHVRPAAALPSPVTSSAAPSPSYADTDGSAAVFLQEIHADGLAQYGADDDQLQLGHTVCASWGHGSTFDQLVQVLTDAGYTAADGVQFLADATSVFCPQYGDDLTSGSASA